MSYRTEAVPAVMKDAVPEAGAERLMPTITQLIVRQAVERAGVTALHDQKTGRRISYRQLASEIRHAAKALAQRGLQKGEVVCLYSPNLPEYAVAVLAVTLAGGVITLAAPTLDAEVLAQRLAITRAQWLVTTKAHLRSAVLAASQSSVRQVYSFDPALGAHHVGELFETVMADDERATEALIDPQRDTMAWLFDEAESATPYSFAAVAARLAEYQMPSGEIELSGVSLAEKDSFLMLLAALVNGETVVL